jgi:hypothetical protein
VFNYSPLLEGCLKDGVYFLESKCSTPFNFARICVSTAIMFLNAAEMILAKVKAGK